MITSHFPALRANIHVHALLFLASLTDGLVSVFCVRACVCERDKDEEGLSGSVHSAKLHSEIRCEAQTTSASWVRQHLYLDLSTCELLTRDFNGSF